MCVNAQNTDEFCLKLYKVNALIQKNHYAPKAINNSFSEYLFDNFLKQLDRNQTIFLQHEIDSLSAYRHLLDDAIFKTQCGFMADFMHYYQRGLKRNLAILQELKEESFESEPSDTLYFVREETPTYFKNAEQIKKIFRKRLTYEVLELVARSSKNKDSLYGQLPVLAEKLRLQQLDNYMCSYENFLNPSPNLDGYMTHLFINEFCSYFDPHTNFFNSDDKTGFVNSISSSNLGFGLIMELSENNEVHINDILTGSPAFRDPLIEKGDRLIRVKFGEEDMEVNCVHMNAVNTYFFSDNYKLLDLTFRKKSGINYQTRLHKEVLKNYENTCYSFLIEGQKKLGYVYIPSFYSNIEGNATNVYDDLLYELNHLKSLGAKGFILDVQFNAGGDMLQAMNMISLFVNQAPVAFFNHRRLGPELLYNFNKKPVYKEPIVLLINGYSASASELFAYALQDQNRAVLLGQKTYGKGTIQTFFPMDEDTEDSELLKITIEKMFRMNGKSHQRLGVQPDITTPALLENLYLREEDYTTALETEEIETGYINKNKLPKSYTKAIAVAKARIPQRNHFKEIAHFNEEFIQQKTGKDTIPLTFEVLFNQIVIENNLFKRFDEVSENTFPLSLKLLDKDKKNIQFNSLLQTMLETKKQRALSNPDIFEAVQVLYDML